MLTCTSYKSMFGTSIHNLGGVSNCLTINELKSKDIDISACGPIQWVTSGTRMYAPALP